MGDMGDFWKDVRPQMEKASRIKRAQNRKRGETELFQRAVPFLKKNAGAHLIVHPEDSKLRCDYWPGTGLWRAYFGTKDGRGIESLLRHIGGPKIVR